MGAPTCVVIQRRGWYNEIRSSFDNGATVKALH
jgi:hypothetical protein